MNEKKLYPQDLDVFQFQAHYIAHVMAMTAEGLHADIAEQLAWRDARIEELQQQLETARYELLRILSFL
jgi:hypothetical protein